MKKVGIAVAVIGVLATIIGVTWQIASSQSNIITTPSEQNSINGNSNILASGQASITTTNNYEAPKGVNIPEFDGQIQPISRTDSEGSRSSEFNEFMLTNDGKIVYLDIWPYYNNEELNSDDFSQFDEPELFTISDKHDDFSAGGSEYIINASDDSDFFWDGRQSSRRIKGYFKIIGVSGPRQGYMSVVIKPVDIEKAELLKK